jgi:hypothetical protein
MTIDPRLMRGETVQWQGQPDPRVHFTRTDSFFVPFSIFWLGFAVVWTVAVSNSRNAPSFIWLFGLLFVAIGIFLTVGRFFVKPASKRRTRYVLTDRRAIVAGPWGVSSIDLKDAAPLVMIRRGGLHVDAVFGMTTGPMSWMPGMSNLTMYANTGMDFFAALGPGLPLAFYDVSDIEALKGALAIRKASRSA